MLSQHFLRSSRHNPATHRQYTKTGFLESLPEWKSLLQPIVPQIKLLSDLRLLIYKKVLLILTGN